jgi:hypothetical protein
MVIILILIGLYAAAVIYTSVWGWAHKLIDRKQYNADLHELRNKEIEFEERVQDKTAKLASAEEMLNRLAEEKSKGFPSLSLAYAEFKMMQSELLASHLETKKQPALRAAEEVRKVAKEKRSVDERLKQLEYLVRYYESLIPGLSDLEEDDVNDAIAELEDEQEVDPVSRWISTEEYNKLSPKERNQLALNNYWLHRKKSAWIVGRDYERYVGYKYEIAGYHVQYHGIEKGKKDLGRDLIAVSKDRKEVRIIQCKHWKKEKEIQINHLYQLFGSATDYKFFRQEKLPLALFQEDAKIIPVFWTSAKLRPNAREASRLLGIEIHEGEPLDKSYPCIKCNYSKTNKEKIYHLPFDQQYDRTKIEDELLECYVSTVTEAEAKGYRRAYRWHGDKSSG